MNYCKEIIFHFLLLVCIIALKIDPILSRPLDKQEISAILKQVEETPIPKIDKRDEYVLETTYGPITIVLFPDQAPNHVANFKRLVLAQFYNNTQFHRIIKGYIIQGGDIMTRDSDPANDGTGGPGYTIKSEFNKIKHKKGILSMARSSDPDSAGSQFFIVLGDAPFLDGRYTVFGRVVKGMKVLDRIASVPVTYSTFNEKSKPITPVILKRVVYISGQPKPEKEDKSKKNNGKKKK